MNGQATMFGTEMKILQAKVGTLWSFKVKAKSQRDMLVEMGLSCVDSLF